MRAGFGDGSGPREDVWGVFWCHHFRWTGCVWRETERIKSDLDLSEVGLAPALTKLTVSWSRQMPIYLEGLIQCCSWLIHSYTILAMTYPTGRGIHIFTKEDLGVETHMFILPDPSLPGRWISTYTGKPYLYTLPLAPVTQR